MVLGKAGDFPSVVTQMIQGRAEKTHQPLRTPTCIGQQTHSKPVENLQGIYWYMLLNQSGATRSLGWF